MLQCPHCGEPIDTYPDPGGGEEQSYIEDCSVCCRPILFHARLDEATGEYDVSVSAEV
ncbi:MAG TPA: CPXCG motif-containing cysteine-rich protein [Polyangiaceae bacterium]